MIIEESHEFEDTQSEQVTEDLQDFEMIREEMDDKIEEMEERLLDEQQSAMDKISKDFRK